MDFALALLLGVISSYISSYLFLKRFVNAKRPEIEISPQIAYHLNKKDNCRYHYFKFVNKTDADIFDVSCELTFMKAINGVDGQNLVGDDVQLNDDFFSQINQKRRDDVNSQHAYWIFTKTDVASMWEEQGNHSFLRLKIIAKHSLTGLSKVFYKDFFKANVIIPGEFRQGDDLTVCPD
jgi:hypothetical protein